MMQARPKLQGRVDDSCGSWGPWTQDLQAQRQRCETRLESLEEFLHGECTESLRTRWCEELAEVHAETLELGDEARAEQLKARLRAHLAEHPAGPSPSVLVQRQHVARARVCLDGARHRVARGQDAQARGRLAELLMSARAVSDHEDGTVVLAQALALAHGVERRIGLEQLARDHLQELHWLESLRPVRGVREPLAQALVVTVHAELAAGRLAEAREHVATLRTMGTRGRASEPQRSMLAEALLALHGHAGPAERVTLEQELGELATRPGAAQDQRNAWALALAEAAHPGPGAIAPPLELLRARAYRSAGTEDLTALFEHLEAELPHLVRSFFEEIGTFNELRAIAERPEADPALRLRFARHWLERPYDARRYDYGAVGNDRSAHAWAQEAHLRGDPEGRVLLGRCLAYGRGVDRNRRVAARLLRRAADQGSDEAQMLLRILWVERFPSLRHRYTVFLCVGMGMLVLHLLTQPFVFNAWGVLAYVGLLLGSMMAMAQLWSWLGRWWPALAPDEDETLATAEDEDQAKPRLRYVVDKMMRQFQLHPWRIAKVTTEDGFSLAPLAWLGVSPLTAAGAGLLFGFAHYPQYRLALCLQLAITQAAVALLILPWAGLWAVTLGHVLYDVIVLAWAGWWTRTYAQ